MATQADIDRNNAEYLNAQNAANYWLSQGNSQAAHEAHKVMQKYAEENQRLAPIVAKANDDFHKANKTGPYAVSDSGSSGSSSSSSSVTSSAPPSPPATTPPNPWLTTPTYTAPAGIKQAEPDIILDRDTNTSSDYIVERFFEELGGTELISLSRHDIIDGINISYNPIANLSKLRKRFNPNNIIAIDALSKNEFSKYSIDLLSRGINEPYFNDNGDLVIEVDIIRPEENIEAEISLGGSVVRIEI